VVSTETWFSSVTHVEEYPLLTLFFTSLVLVFNFETTRTLWDTVDQCLKKL